MSANVQNQHRYITTPNFLKPALPFLIGGISGMVATLVIHPLDTFKVQMQVISQQYGIKNKADQATQKSASQTQNSQKNNFKQNVSITKIIKTIQQEKGLMVLYRGLQSSLWRQLVYASARLGTYNAIVSELQKNGREIGFLQKSLISIFAGFIGAMVGTPFDVALVRRQASVTTGKKQYKSTYSAFKSIISEDGVLGLWTGLKITIIRVLLINFGQLAAHDKISQALKVNKYLSKHRSLQDNLSAVIASCLTAAISLPADNIKVKLQKQAMKQIEYKGIYDCFVKTLKRQGVLRLWVGLPIYLVRGAPHSFILIRVQQYLRRVLIEDQRKKI